MSRLEIEIRSLVGSYLRKDFSTKEFREKQVDLMGWALEANDKEALDIADEIELMLAERSSGERTEEQLREGLRPFASIAEIIEFTHEGQAGLRTMATATPAD